ncbi:MAG: hypothetical protein ACHQF0_08310 [Chitinophagales bacterium]
MKKVFFLSVMMCSAYIICAQNYPEPEFSNEVYYLNKKDTGYSVMRLEKGASGMAAKTKMAGFGGSEQGYTIDDSKSSIRLAGGNNLSFVYSLGNSSQSSSSKSDSAMRANGMDPSMMQGMMGGMNDPSKFTLYKLDIEKGARKIFLMKSGGANPFSNHKMQSSDKYTFSVKKIRDGYWVLVTDKALPKGEYAFTMMDMTSGSMGVTYFAFGVD